jgi:hypothetical protein
MGAWKPERGLTAGWPRLATPAYIERRQRRRQRTRLRPGKIVAPDGRFLAHCRFHDLATGGARLRTEGEADIPDRFFIIDDCNGEVAYALVAWRNVSEIGVSFAAPPAGVSLTRQRMAYLARKFYRVGAVCATPSGT